MINKDIKEYPMTLIKPLLKSNESEYNYYGYYYSYHNAESKKDEKKMKLQQEKNEISRRKNTKINYH